MHQILESLFFDAEEGKLDLQGLRYLLMRPTLLSEIQRSLEMELPEEVATILSNAAQTEGLAFAGRLKDVFSYPADQVLSSLAFMMGESGWGAISVQMLNLEREELVLKVQGSPFAEEYGPSVRPVCHLLLGLFRGAGMVVFDRDVIGEEVQCAAKGNPACLFVVSAKPA